MHELILLIATMLPTEKIVADLVEAANDLMIFPDDKEKQKMLATNCLIFIAHMKTQGNPDKLIETMEEVRKMEDRRKLFETEDN